MTERQCGACDLCCTWVGVVDLGKPEWTPCKHLAPAGGCAIHGNHPHECQTFRCGWLTSPDLPDEWRPRESRFIMTVHSTNGAIMVYADPANPTTWQNPPYRDGIKRIAIRARTEKRHMLVSTGALTWAVFPEDDIPITLHPGDQIKVGYHVEAELVTPRVTVLSDGRRTEYHGLPFRAAAPAPA